MTFNAQKGMALILGRRSANPMISTLTYQSPPSLLPNAEGAQAYQRTVLGTLTGGYQSNSNGCATHVVNVLQAGGAPANGPASTLTLARVLRSLGTPRR